jgi:hypothetical protein
MKATQQWILGGLAGGLTGGLAVTYALLVEPEWVEVCPVTVELPRLDAPFDGYTIAQISDLHIDSWLGRERLEDVVAKVNQQEPDVVVITGDFVSEDLPENTGNLIAALRLLEARDAIAAVTGNHDYDANVDNVRSVMEESNIHDLSNHVLTLERGDTYLHIAGVDDPMEGKPDLDEVLRRLPDEGAAILLAHEPDFADKAAATGRFDLQLSGHSHGGQIQLPIIGPINLPEMGKKYPIGMYQLDGMKLYTNRGIGMVELKARFNCRPEITVFTLRVPEGGA